MRNLICMLALALAACGGGGTPATSDLATPSDLAVTGALAGAPAPTYAGFAQPFFVKYCISCHPSASSTRDFTQYSVLQQNAHNIACGVSPTALSGCSGNPAPSQFPIGSGPFPTDDERRQLVVWVQDGLPQ